MNFLKKHYEKLLLVLMLIIFLVSLFYQVDIITGADKITPDDLKLPPMHPDYENIDFKSAAFKDESTFMDNTDWVETTPKNPKDKVFTDLMVNFPASRCPHPKCQKIVPRYFFMNLPHKCPICGGDLPTPSKAPTPQPIVSNSGDSDNDGIPDQEEIKIGSNPQKPDSETDTDGDGFANIYEYKQGTNGGNPKDHPPLYERLYVKDIRRSPLDIQLKKVTALGTDKSDWDVQVNIQGGRKSTFLTIGDTIKINNKNYKLADILVKKERRIERSVKVDKDVSEIILKSLKGDDTIVAVRNQDVYSSKPQAVLIDELDGKELTVEQDSILTLGTSQTGMEKYRVLNVDPAKEEVSLMDLKRKRQCRVTKTLLIPKIRKETENAAPGMGDGMMPDDPAMLNLRKGQNKSLNSRPPI